MTHHERASLWAGRQLASVQVIISGDFIGYVSLRLAHARLYDIGRLGVETELVGLIDFGARRRTGEAEIDVVLSCGGGDIGVERVPSGSGIEVLYFHDAGWRAIHAVEINLNGACGCCFG